MIAPVLNDCNVLVSAVLSRRADSPPAEILQLALNGDVEYLLSPDVLAEYRAVLSRPRLSRRHGKEAADLAVLVAELIAEGEVLFPHDQPEEGPDPGDAHLWRLLRMRSDAVLVTGDQALLQSAPTWARVMSPREWIVQYRSQVTPSSSSAKQSHDTSE